MLNTHINVTVDCTKIGGGVIDLRLPGGQRISKLIVNILKALRITINIVDVYYIKVPTKKLILLNGSDELPRYITNGDVIEICK